MIRIMTFVEDFSSPAKWPTKFRRAFVLTLPVSGPIWLAAMTVLVFAAFVALAVLQPVLVVHDIWTGNTDGK